MKNFIRFIRQLIIRFIVKISSDNLIASPHKSLIIAPHPDDETFGCAGLIALKLRQGADISVIFLTSGENSLEEISSGEIAFHRENSAKDAMKVLGVTNLYFMKFTDGKIPRRDHLNFSNAQKQVRSLIEKISPEEVFCTHISEGWSDHTAAAELTTDALKQLDHNIKLYYYWVWIWFSLPLRKINILNFANTFYLPIKDAIKQKSEAINIYLYSVDKNNRAYCGNLPKMFLKAFEWPYEVFEKVEYK